MHPPAPACPSPIRSLAAFLPAVLVCLGLMAIAHEALAQARTAIQPATPASATASRPVSAKSAASAVKVTKQTRPLWAELTEPQRQALAPLGRTWDTISEAQKRKWLALSENFPKMPAPEQAKLHSRMTEWVALSSQQRTQARLNFGETKQLSPDDKKAKWEAYQALTPEQKLNLAAGAAKKPPATAAAIKPVPAVKMATVPPAKDVVRVPRIAAGMPQVEHNPLLPPLAPVGQTN